MNSQNQKTDQELINQILNGSQDLYRELVLRYQNRIFSLLMRQINQPALAEDLAQDVFIKAYKNLKNFRGEAKFYTWLVRIALNETSNYFSSKAYRQNLRKVEAQELSKEESQLITNIADPNASLEQKQMLTALRLCFSKLKPDFREILSLCVFDSFAYEDAASYFRIPVGTVRSRLNSARLLVKNCMKARGLYE